MLGCTRRKRFLSLWPPMRPFSSPFCPRTKESHENDAARAPTNAARDTCSRRCDRGEPGGRAPSPVAVPPLRAAPMPAAPPPAVDLGREVIAAGRRLGVMVRSDLPRARRAPRRARHRRRRRRLRPRCTSSTPGRSCATRSPGSPGGSQNDARYNQVPRIVYVTGAIDPWVQPDGTRLTCDDIAAQVTVAGHERPVRDGRLHRRVRSGHRPAARSKHARVAAAALQAQLTLQHIGSNVTLVGVGDDATRLGRLASDPRCAQRDRAQPHALGRLRLLPAVGRQRLRRQLELRVRQPVGVDRDERVGRPQHLRRRRAPADEPRRSSTGVRSRCTTACIDVTHGGDLVTMSWNWLQHHDKTDIIGSSDSRAPGPRSAPRHPAPQPLDRHRAARSARALRRRPRLQQPLRADRGIARARPCPAAPSSSTSGARASRAASSRSRTPSNCCRRPRSQRIIACWKGTELSETGTLVNGEIVDVLGAFNATSPSTLSPTSGGTRPTQYGYQAQPVGEVAAAVRAGAGAGILNSGTPVATARTRRLRAVGRQRLGHRTARRRLPRSRANLWWGQNATVVKLYENGVLIAAQALGGSSARPRSRPCSSVTGQGERHVPVRARRAQSVR